MTDKTAFVESALTIGGVTQFQMQQTGGLRGLKTAIAAQITASSV